MRDDDLTRYFTDLRLVHHSLEPAPGQARQRRARTLCRQFRRARRAPNSWSFGRKVSGPKEEPVQPGKSCKGLSCHETCQAADTCLVG